MNIKKQFKEGLITNNPVLVQLIGMCATMAITTTLFNGVGMGISVLIILTCCNVVVSAIRKCVDGIAMITVPSSDDLIFVWMSLMVEVEPCDLS